MHHAYPPFHFYYLTKQWDGTPWNHGMGMGTNRWDAMGLKWKGWMGAKDSFVLIGWREGGWFLRIVAKGKEWIAFCDTNDLFVLIGRWRGVLWIQYCIRLHRFVLVRFVLVCIEGTGHNGMVMGNVNVHSFLWKECNYCICLFWRKGAWWNGDGCEWDFPFFYHGWILINYSNYFLWYQNISSLTKKNKMNKTKIRLNICIQMHNN